MQKLIGNHVWNIASKVLKILKERETFLLYYRMVSQWVCKDTSMQDKIQQQDKEYMS